MVFASEHNLARTHRRKNAILRLSSQDQAPIDGKSSAMILNVAQRRPKGGCHGMAGHENVSGTDV